MSRAAALLAVALLATACTHVQMADGTRAHTFGSGTLTVETADGATIMAESDGTNVLGIFDAIANAVRGVFGGGGGDTVVNVNSSGTAPARRAPELRRT